MFSNDILNHSVLDGSVPFNPFNKYKGNVKLKEKTMRTIKFRAWSIPDKIMSHQEPNGYFKGAYYSADYRALQDVNLGILIQKHNLGSIVLMQYTGLNDKNGKEIYEGDVINYLTNRNEDGSYGTDFKFLPENAKTVFFEDGIFKCDGHVSLWDCIRTLRYTDKPHYEIIGTIYENPELLQDNK